MIYKNLNELAIATCKQEVSIEQTRYFITFYMAAEKAARDAGYIGVGVITFAEENFVLFQVNPEDYEGWKE